MALSLQVIKEILDCEVITCEELIGKISVESGCAADMMSDVLAFSEPGALLITGLKNSQAVRTADIAEVRAIIFARGKRPDPDAVELARELGMPLFCTNQFVYDVCGLLFEHGLKGTAARKEDKR